MKRITSFVLTTLLIFALAPCWALADTPADDTSGQEQGQAEPAEPVDPEDPEPAVNILENYNPAAAIKYSERYVFNYNPAYFDCNPIGGDCANFVSQCLEAGGIPMTKVEGGDWKHPDAWYSDTNVSKWSTNHTSASWINCEWMYKYFSNIGSVVICKNTAKGRAAAQDKVWPGSIVLFSNSKGTAWNHAVFCVGYDSNGTPIINCHNSSRYHVPWYYLSKSRSAKICIIRLTSEPATKGIIKEGSKRWKQQIEAADVTKTIKESSLKKSSKAFSAKALALGDAQVKYAKASGSSKLAVSASTGTVTVNKGTKAGKYTATIKASTAKTVTYKAASKTYTVTVTVK